MIFKTNREVRLERILRALVALDNGDEPYWWKVEHSALIADAKDELNAAPQRFETVRLGQESVSSAHASAVAASKTPLTDENVLAEIPGQMWVDSFGVKRDRVLGDFARHLEIELRMQDDANDLLTKRLEEMTMWRNEWKARAMETKTTCNVCGQPICVCGMNAGQQALAYTTSNEEAGVVSRSTPAVSAPEEFTFAASYKNGYETAIETAAQHVEGQLCVWDHTGVITAHVLQTIAKKIRALKDAPQPYTK